MKGDLTAQETRDLSMLRDFVKWFIRSGYGMENMLSNPIALTLAYIKRNRRRRNATLAKLKGVGG